ncbi:MAG TPA: hemolysin family protein [Vicinamibacterales bacterium]|nr:hemolysin family protein [Vicinamibacterales bacterium]
MDSVIAIAVITALVVANGLFVAAEFAIVGAPRPTIRRLADRGHRAARLVLNVLSDPIRQDRFIATAQLGITVASLGLGMYGEHVVASWIADQLEALGAGRWIAAHAVASAVAVTILTYLHIVVGEMVPKSLALQYADRVVLWIAPPMVALKNAVYPLVIALNGAGNLMLRMLGIRRQVTGSEHYYTPEELQIIVEESEEGGALREESGLVLRELFEFGALTAAEVMVPRVRVVGLPVRASADDIVAVLRSARHTRYPVFDGDLDHIVGIVHIKDLLRLAVARQPLDQTKTLPVPVVPETSPLDDVLATLRREQTQMAVVLDEHGGTAGIITLSDLFSEVAGEIEDGSTARPARDSHGRLRAPGTMRIAEVGQQFDLDLEHADVDSVSGLVLMLLGRPPQVGDVVDFGRLRFEVTAVKGHGVDEAAVTLLPDL